MEAARKMSTAKKFAFSLVVLFLFLALVEGYARVRTYHDTGNGKFLWSTPYAAHRFGLSPLPYRGSALSQTKPPGGFRFAALGGSTTFGWGIEEDSKTWPAQLERILNRRSGKARFEVMNLGEPHATSGKVLRDRLPVAKKYHPDFYLIFSGYNDYDKALREKVSEGRRASVQGGEQGPREPAAPKREPGFIQREDLIERLTLLVLSYSVFAHRLREFIAKVWYGDIDYFYKREKGAGREAAAEGEAPAGPERVPQARRPPPRLLEPWRRITIDLPAVVAEFQLNLTEIFRQIKAERAGAMILTLPVQWNHPGARHILESGSLDALNRTVREVAARQGVFLCDVEGAFRRHPDPSRLFIWDYFHPDENGARLIAETVADCLRRAGGLPP